MLKYNYLPLGQRQSMIYYTIKICGEISLTNVIKILDLAFDPDYRKNKTEIDRLISKGLIDSYYDDGWFYEIV